MIFLEAETRLRNLEDAAAKKATLEEKLIAAAQRSLEVGMFYKELTEYPDRSSSYSERLLRAMPMDSKALWILRSKLDTVNDSSFQPRKNFQFEICKLFFDFTHSF